jgi:hypothetical protein
MNIPSAFIAFAYHPYIRCPFLAMLFLLCRLDDLLHHVKPLNEAHAKILDLSLAFTLRCEHLILAQAPILMLYLTLKTAPTIE